MWCEYNGYCGRPPRCCLRVRGLHMHSVFSHRHHQCCSSLPMLFGVAYLCSFVEPNLPIALFGDLLFLLIRCDPFGTCCLSLSYCTHTVHAAAAAAESPLGFFLLMCTVHITVGSFSVCSHGLVLPGIAWFTCSCCCALSLPAAAPQLVSICGHCVSPSLSYESALIPAISRAAPTPPSCCCSGCGLQFAARRDWVKKRDLA